MSSSGALQESSIQDPEQAAAPSDLKPIELQNEARVYNLTALVRIQANHPVTARAANLAMPAVEGSTIREALSKLVKLAKSQIGQELEQANDIPWIDPPAEPSEQESRYVVPLHL